MLWLFCPVLHSGMSGCWGHRGPCHVERPGRSRTGPMDDGRQPTPEAGILVPRPANSSVTRVRSLWMTILLTLQPPEFAEQSCVTSHPSSMRSRAVVGMEKGPICCVRMEARVKSSCSRSRPSQAWRWRTVGRDHRGSQTKTRNPPDPTCFTQHQGAAGQVAREMTDKAPSPPSSGRAGLDLEQSDWVLPVLQGPHDLFERGCVAPALVGNVSYSRGPSECHHHSTTRSDVGNCRPAYCRKDPKAGCLAHCCCVTTGFGHLE
jgi:hypothetical protein